jgi:hypothetical protein
MNDIVARVQYMLRFVNGASDLSRIRTPRVGGESERVATARASSFSWNACPYCSSPRRVSQAAIFTGLPCST